MNEPLQRHPEALSTLLLSSDFSKGAGRALRRVSLLPLPLKAKVYLLHVMPDGATLSAKLEEAAKVALDQARSTLLGFFERQGRGDIEVHALLERGRPSSEVIRSAERLQPGLVVAGRRGEQELRDVFLGSTAARLVRSGVAPVLLVEKAARAPYRRVAASVAIGQEMAPLLTWSARLAAEGSLLGAVHGVDAPKQSMIFHRSAGSEELQKYRAEARAYARERLDAELAQAQAEAGLDPKSVLPVLRSGDPRVVIPRWAQSRNLDLMVLGNRGRGQIAQAFLGSVAEELVRRLPCDTLVVPASA